MQGLREMFPRLLVVLTALASLAFGQGKKFRGAREHCGRTGF